MSRYSSNGSYGHSIRATVWGDYRLSWSVDRYYAGSRLRFPTGYSRDTDYAGAVRFAKKWGLEPPVAESDAPNPSTPSPTRR